MKDYLNVRKEIEDVFLKYKEKTAIEYMLENGGKRKFRYGEIHQNILSFETVMREHRIKAGDRVAILTPHSPYGIITCMACAYWNLTSVLLDASLPEQELKRLLNLSDVRAVFTTEKFSKAECVRKYSDIPVFDIEREDFSYPVFEGYSDVVKMEQTKDPDEEVIAILFSSGTTSSMKGIMITYQSIPTARDIFTDLAGLKPEMSYLLVLPFNHIAGFTGAMTYLLTGCTLGMIENVNASKLQKGLLEFQPSYFAMVPRVYEVMEQKIRQAVKEKGKAAEISFAAMLRISGFLRKYLGIKIGRKLFAPVLGSVFGKNIFGLGTGAAPCKEKTAEFFLNMGIEWANLYAATETGVPIAATGIHDRYPVGTVGNVRREKRIEVRIKNPDHEGCGEICVKSPLLMKGYFRDSELTREAFEDGYFKTGDYGYIDKKGYLYVTGRMKENIVLKNGKKVSPSEIDEYYSMRHPDLMLACRGIPEQEGLEDKVHLFVEESSGNSELREQMRYALERTSRNAETMYQVSKIHFVDKIPLTSIGKVKRHLLVEPKLSKTDCNIVTEPQLSSNTVLTDEEELIQIIRNVMDENDTGFQILPEMELHRDLGLDSLNIFALCAEVNEKFGVLLEEKLHNHITVSEIQALIQKDDNVVNISGENSSLDMSQFPAKRNRVLDRKLKRWINISKWIYRFEVSGLENIPHDVNFLVCANHASYFDPIWILAAMGYDRFSSKKLACLAAIQTLNQKRDFFDMLGAVPVEREGNTAPAIKRIKECLDTGYMVILFPEGSRSRDGNMLPFKNGAAMLAIDTEKPIIPVQIKGAFEIFPRHRKYPAIWDLQNYRRFKLKICFGKPILPQGYTVQELTHKLRQTIEEM